ncbi:MAG TPA: hypothetical protein VGD81_10735 [Opitutaceae bacterium]
MKTTKLILVPSLALALAAGSAFARGPGGGGGHGRMQCDPTLCPNGGVPALDGSGRQGTASRGNPKSVGTPLRDGSGKATAPGRGAKDGTGNRAACPSPARS